MSDTKETKFKKWLLEKSNNLVSNRINRMGDGERKSHLRFRNGCGIKTLNEFTNLLDNLNVSYIHNDEYTGSPLYKGQGIDCNWNGISIGVLIAVAQEGKIERKRYTPASLNLSGCEFDTAHSFKERIIKELEASELDPNGLECLKSLIDNIDSKNTIPVIYNSFLKTNLNKITSDFGEILAAYNSVVMGHKIRFPSTSNNSISDYYENNIPVSAKGRNAGGKVNLSEFKDIIPCDTDLGNLIYSLANHDKNLLFKSAAVLSPEIQIIADWVGGTNISDVELYVKNMSYDEFYKKIKDTESFMKLGIPLKSKDDRPRQLWSQGDTNPFYFTLNTLIHRIYGLKHISEITEIVSKFLQEAKFVHVDIQNSSVIIKETPFSSVDKWGTEYHSRATKAWHNWMGIQLIGNQK